MNKLMITLEINSTEVYLGRVFSRGAELNTKQIVNLGVEKFSSARMNESVMHLNLHGDAVSCRM